MVEKILNNTTPYGKIRASHEGSLHSSTLIQVFGHRDAINIFLEILKYRILYDKCIRKKLHVFPLQSK